MRYAAFRITFGSLLFTGLLSAKEAPRLPGPAPLLRATSISIQALNDRCESCHSEIAQEWRASYHRMAYFDPAVQKALLAEPKPFCRACHAPEAAPRTPAAGWAAANGVACVTCHVPGPALVIVSGPAQGSRKPPHPIYRSADFVNEGACAACHEFSFPDGKHRTRPELMQSTVSEHRQSPFSETSCIDCHMPRRAGHRTHSFSSGHDAALLRKSLKVEVERAGPATVRLLLTPQKIGHAFPTGDLFRSLKLSVAVLNSQTSSPGEQVVRSLSRHFSLVEQVSGHAVRVTHRDDRLRGPTAILLSLSDRAVGRPLRYRVSYERVLFPSPGGNLTTANPTLDGEVLLAEGQIP